MSVIQEQPYRTKSFVVDLGDGEAQGFLEVRLPEATFEILEYREGDAKTGLPRKLVGRANVGNLILRRGFNGRLDLYEWFQQTLADSETTRRNILIKLISEDGESVVTQWKLRNAWPCSHSFSPLDAICCETLIESLEVACESVEME